MGRFPDEPNPDKLLNSGDVSEHVHAQFLTAAKSFLIKVDTYLQKWCPIDDELLLEC